MVLFHCNTMNIIQKYYCFNLVHILLILWKIDISNVVEFINENQYISGKTMNTLVKPEWLRIKVPSGNNHLNTIERIKTKALCTVCVEALCPNQLECFHKGTATFMLLGPGCTRRCSFCAVDKHHVAQPDPMEPDLIADAVCELGTQYCVLTMVTRDDLDDGGASHLRNTVKAIRQRCPAILIELLISDLSGNWDALTSVLQMNPAVLNHNIETVKRLYALVRPQALYSRSLSLLEKISLISPTTITKSGMMLGLGESRTEVIETMDDLRKCGCQILTIGQYLAPSEKHHPVIRYIHPDEFEDYRAEALRRGFIGVASGPFVRSSYKAEKLYNLSIAAKKITLANKQLLQ